VQKLSLALGYWGAADRLWAGHGAAADSGKKQPSAADSEPTLFRMLVFVYKMLCDKVLGSYVLGRPQTDRAYFYDNESISIS